MTVKHLYTESLYNSLEIRVNLYGLPSVLRLHKYNVILE